MTFRTIFFCDTVKEPPIGSWGSCANNHIISIVLFGQLGANLKKLADFFNISCVLAHKYFDDMSCGQFLKEPSQNPP